MSIYIDDDKNRDPKRNNFNSLLTLLDQGDESVLNKSERQLIIAIRNAFSPNHYDVALNDIARKSELNKATLLYIAEEDANGKKAELTTIATLIAKKLEALQQKVETFQK